MAGIGILFPDRVHMQCSQSGTYVVHYLCGRISQRVKTLNLLKVTSHKYQNNKMSPDKMSQKLICKYENFGFCKKREDCENLHPTENCFDDNCNIINCTKRHPQPCRFFGTQEGCRFGSSCKFDHRRQMCLQSELQEMKNKQAIQEDTIRQLNERITSLETKLSTLGNDTLVSDDSNEMLSQLKKKRKISISYPNDDNQEVIRDVNKMIDDSKTDIRTDVEMTETCTKDQ